MDDDFKNECATLLQLAEEISVKYKKRINIVVFPEGKGWANSTSEDICTVGYIDPKEQVLIR
jgi:hypothetical protein